MANCGQACPYNTLDGCKAKEHNAICPLTNMATPITEYRMTNADRIRAMSDEELANTLLDIGLDIWNCNEYNGHNVTMLPECEKCDGYCVLAILKWLKQSAEEE